jgi:hypothetical protein
MARERCKLRYLSDTTDRDQRSVAFAATFELERGPAKPTDLRPTRAGRWRLVSPFLVQLPDKLVQRSLQETQTLTVHGGRGK